ncbi:hypothetical protein DL766_001364 [Monosporascus sp. MC13-8B]|uniref:DUF1479 domain protein n=1 Tax=Monosporascus cannonballus TaxID=155416 RepID=A0ABY0HK89_9PEZI|nr:hypothetical protein DL763_005002 [Monosporascus cannonballus]RYO93244.1 hypothetical protein DL762_001193 [Monosporascus cannonballus]RYP37715.1 hypothetical protein DL766_001364 [Monosporascus sp. MC13-8B]
MSKADVVQGPAAALPSQFQSGALAAAPVTPANVSNMTVAKIPSTTSTTATATSSTATASKPISISDLITSTNTAGSKRQRNEDHKSDRTKIRATRMDFAKIMDPPIVSFYGSTPIPLPSRFGHLKRRLVSGRETVLKASWDRLLAALRDEIAHIESHGTELMPMIDFSDIEDPSKVQPWSASLKRYGIGVIRGVVPPEAARSWVEETKKYLETNELELKPPPAQDPTCFDFFWTPAQVRSRAHPNVLRAQRFAMTLWKDTKDEFVATRYPITYADRIRIESAASDGYITVNGSRVAVSPQDSLIAAAAATSSEEIAQVDNGSLERWEQDGYGRAGLYNSIFEGDWESYDEWDASGRVNATPDLYNGQGACSMLRLFQGIIALTEIEPGMIKILPSPKLSTVYFLLRPFFSPKEKAPEGGPSSEKWATYLDPSNWTLDKEQSTIIHGAVAGHAQRVTSSFHPHLELKRSLVAPPTLPEGSYIIWHPDIAYQFSNTNYSTNARPTTSSGEPASTTSMLVYAPAAPLTQQNALYLARQRKAFLRGHPGPDFDSTGTGLGSEAPHTGRLTENGIKEVGGEEGLQAMGLAPWNLGKSIAMTTDPKNASPPSTSSSSSDPKDKNNTNKKDDEESSSSVDGSLTPKTHAEVEVLKLANQILFPDRFDFYMPTRAPSRAASRATSPAPSKDREKDRDKGVKDSN